MNDFFNSVAAEVEAEIAGNEARFAANQQRLMAMVAEIRPGAAIDAAAGKLPQPASAAAAAGGTSLDSPQQAMAIGEPLPVVFGRRREGAGGVLVQPKATEARFEYSTTTINSAYHCVLGEGRIGNIQVRDVRRGACRVGAFSQNYNRRAGNWAPGVFSSVIVPGAPAFPTVTGGGGNYEAISTIEFRGSCAMGRGEWATQWNVFVRRGLIIERGRLLDGNVDASDNIADLVLWAWLRSNRVKGPMIDLPAMTRAARFVEANKLWCNGEFKDSVNIVDWLTRLLPYFLLRLTKKGGKHALRPLLPTNPDGTISTGAVFPACIINEASIVPGSFSQEWSDVASRQPLHLTMLWRQQATDIDTPVARSFELAPSGFAGVSEQHDLSQFCTTENHAAMDAVYLAARRQLSTHTASVRLRPGSQTGTIAEGDIVIVSFNMATPEEPGAVFAGWYSVEAIGHSATGEEELSLAHFPVNSSNQSLIALAVADAHGIGNVLPAPDVVCDDGARSEDTTVPDASTSGTPFSEQSPDGTGGNGDVVQYPNSEMNAGGGNGSSKGGNPSSSRTYQAVTYRDGLLDLFFDVGRGSGAPDDSSIYGSQAPDGTAIYSPSPDIEIGGYVPQSLITQINQGIEKPGAGRYALQALGFAPNNWQSAEVVFEVYGGGWHAFDPDRGTGVTIGSGSRFITATVQYPAGNFLIVPGGEIKYATVGDVYVQGPAQALITDQAFKRVYYGGGFNGYVPTTWIIDKNDNPQKAKIASWKRLS